MKSNTTALQWLWIALALVLTITVCVAPMGNLPLWNGETPAHRNQYELMAEAILDGRISFDYGDEHTLAGLKNPYDPAERKEAGVYYHWDHAYYNGTYYMYFGIVPVFLTFLPYRVLTGHSLTTYHATQVFVAVVIVGIFALFYLLRKKFFPQMPLFLYISLAAAFSVMSVWYSSAEPALYCTAITAAICLEVWSLYFFVLAVWYEENENRQILFAAIGALLGALVFGCRPPIGLANIVVLPCVYVFLRNRKFSRKLLGKLCLAAAPYAVVAAALMIYNYARFENPFEFGQAYQLTVADQSNYKVTLNAANTLRIYNNTVKNFFAFSDSTITFPYLKTNSVFANFPILLLGLWLFRQAVWRKAKTHRLLPFFAGLVVAVLVITAFDILWSPYLLERYRMDIYFLMGIGCFTVIGLGVETTPERRRNVLSGILTGCAVLTLVAAWLLYARTVGVYYPERMKELGQLFGLS